ncbi:hypothetical protein HYH03_006511 [Edaphochlamys debaryana]|uniref:NADH-cytochrome b5 reductase n=1 Tax=Edaphochlamys debaryana TaxID=47281 RepID=A0A836C157_9CHLO|nr:hypothetical protein HYH03_006511 [Edaphochlamys debaryana]|eukprot:KAG2495238.1 hypothetical protein HYH03_006511 [Edaphochlamys debaryana]
MNDALGALVPFISYWQGTLGLLVFVILIQVVVFLRRKTRKPFLNPTEFQQVPLVEKTQLTHNTVRLRFALPDSDMRLGLPIGQHITFLAQDAEGKDVYRPYTPVSDDDQLGCVDFVIKLYPEGKMSQILARMALGQTMAMKGPKGRFTYEPNMVKKFGMIAGGTGITPMFQVINAILKNPKDTTKISLLYGNLSEQDILLRKELDQLEAMHGDRLSVYHVLNSVPPGWQGGAGFITRDMISKQFGEPSQSIMTLRCGPTPMCAAMQEHLTALGYTPEQQFQF